MPNIRIETPAGTVLVPAASVKPGDTPRAILPRALESRGHDLRPRAILTDTANMVIAPDEPFGNADRTLFILDDCNSAKDLVARMPIAQVRWRFGCPPREGTRQPGCDRGPCQQYRPSSPAI